MLLKETLVNVFHDVCQLTWVSNCQHLKINIVGLLPNTLTTETWNLKINLKFDYIYSAFDILIGSILFLNYDTYQYLSLTNYHLTSDKTIVSIVIFCTKFNIEMPLG